MFQKIFRHQFTFAEIDVALKSAAVKKCHGPDLQLIAMKFPLCAAAAVVLFELLFTGAKLVLAKSE